MAKCPLPPNLSVCHLACPIISIRYWGFLKVQLMTVRHSVTANLSKSERIEARWISSKLARFPSTENYEAALWTDLILATTFGQEQGPRIPSVNVIDLELFTDDQSWIERRFRRFPTALWQPKPSAERGTDKARGHLHRAGFTGISRNGGPAISAGDEPRPVAVPDSDEAGLLDRPQTRSACPSAAWKL